MSRSICTSRTRSDCLNTASTPFVSKSVNGDARSSSWPHPSPEPAGGCGLHCGLSDGQTIRTWKCSSCPHHGRTLDSQERSDPASRHIAFLIAGLTKIRVTTGSCAAARTRAVRSYVPSPIRDFPRSVRPSDSAEKPPGRNRQRRAFWPAAACGSRNTVRSNRDRSRATRS